MDCNAPFTSPPLTAVFPPIYHQLLLYDSLGLAEPGKAHELVRRKDNTYGGRWVINPSGGLESKGHPLGATGLGNAFYLVTQLRGWAGPMQVPEIVPGDKSKIQDPFALLHNLGLGGCRFLHEQTTRVQDPPSCGPSTPEASSLNCPRLSSPTLVNPGGACVVGLFKRPDFYQAGGKDGRSR